MGGHPATLLHRRLGHGVLQGRTLRRGGRRLHIERDQRHHLVSISRASRAHIALSIASIARACAVRVACALLGTKLRGQRVLEKYRVAGPRVPPLTLATFGGGSRGRAAPACACCAETCHRSFVFAWLQWKTRTLMALPTRLPTAQTKTRGAGRSL